MDDICNDLHKLDINNKLVDYKNDISGLSNINELYNNSNVKNWIKLISKKEAVLFEEYIRKEFFKEILDIKIDNEGASADADAYLHLV